MSQHILYSQFKNREVVVMMGWDRPLQRYYLCIFESESEKLLYSDQRDRDKTVEAMTTEYFSTVLSNFNIHVPDVFIQNVNDDGRKDVKDRIVKYRQIDGEVWCCDSVCN